MHRAGSEWIDIISHNPTMYSYSSFFLATPNKAITVGSRVLPAEERRRNEVKGGVGGKEERID